MKITAKLKAHALSKGWTKADATDEQVKTAVSGKLASGVLTADQFAILSKSAPTPGKKALTQAVETALARKGLNPAASLSVGTVQETGDVPAYVKALRIDRASPVDDDGNPTGERAVSFLVKSAADIYVKAPSQMYRKDRDVGKHFKTNRPVNGFDGLPVRMLSEQMLAKLGAFVRWKLSRSSAASMLRRPLDNHEKALVAEMLATEDFYLLQGEDHKLMPGAQVKALLNDSGSGGQELVPYWFDDAAITFPLLHSQLLPDVTIRDVPYGNSTEGASVGNPTPVWGTAEGTALTYFDTTSLCADFSTTIYPLTIALEVGIDLMSDTPIQVGSILQENIGQAVLKELDNVIANGTGSSRPTGLFLSSGTTIVPAAGGDPSVADPENLMFGMPLQYRDQNWKPAFVMNDNSYKRLCQIQVSETDQRRVFGLDHAAYSLFKHPVKIQNSISDNDMAFVALLKYILYRRKGWDLRTVTEGITLAKTNTIAFVGRGRFGGKLSDGAAMAEMNDYAVSA